MEERETWPAMFLRPGCWATGNLAKTYRWVHVFLREDYTLSRRFRFVLRVVWFLVNHADVHSATMSEFKLESLILAQNERWRQA
jgi:hypothetical protein